MSAFAFTPALLKEVCNYSALRTGVDVMNLVLVHHTVTRDRAMKRYEEGHHREKYEITRKQLGRKPHRREEFLVERTLQWLKNVEDIGPQDIYYQCDRGHL